MTGQHVHRYVADELDWPALLHIAAAVGVTVYRSDPNGNLRPVRSLDDLQPTEN